MTVRRGRRSRQLLDDLKEETKRKHEIALRGELVFERAVWACHKTDYE